MLRNGDEKILDVLNIITNVFTALFISIVFFVNIFNFTSFQNVNILLWLYIYVIIMSILQIIKCLLAGSKYFPKVAYDFAILSIPPIIISIMLLPYILGISNANNNTFGYLDVWHLSAVSVLSVVMFAYIIALNFSSKSGQKFFIRWFDNGIFISSILMLLGASFVVPAFGLLLVLILPSYLIRFHSQKTILSKVKIFLIILIGISNLFSILLNLDTYIDIAQNIIIVYNLLFILFILFLLAKRKFDFSTILIDIKKAVKHFLKSKMTIKQNIKIIITGFIFIFFLVSSIWLIESGLLKLNIEAIFNDYVNYFRDISSLKQLLLGNNISLSSTYQLSLLESYGLLGLIILWIIIGFIIYKQIYMLKRNSDIIHKSIFIALIAFMIWSFIYNINATLLICFWMLIGIIMIINRPYDIALEKAKIIHPHIKNIDKQRIFEAVRILLIIFSVIIMFIALHGLSDIVNRGMFY